MKKLLIFALLLALVIALPVAASAQEPVQDSSYIEPEILVQMDLRDSDRVVKIFHVSLPWSFLDFEGIETVLADQEKLPTYAVLSGDFVLRSYQLNEFGELEQLTNSNGYSPKAIQEYVNHGGLNRVGEGLEVTASYIFIGGYHWETAVYYETNKGDFVYFDNRAYPFHKSYGEFIMPLKEYVWLAEKNEQYYQFMEPFPMGGRPYPMYGYEGFEIHAEDFDMRYRPDPYWVAMWVIAFVVGGSALLATHLIKKRRSLRQQEGPRMLPDPTPRYAYCFHIL